MKTFFFLLVCFLLAFSDVCAKKIVAQKAGLPIIRIETETEILLYNAGETTYRLPWNPMDPDSALQVLNAHNQVRKGLGLRMLKWSYKLEQSSWFWNRNCVPAHDPALPLNVGENIVSVTSKKIPPADFAIGGSQQWLAEISNYVCETDSCVPVKGGLKTEVCGHFVQAIWNTTTHIGCSMVACTENSPFSGLGDPMLLRDPDRDDWLQMNCRYYPPALAGDRAIPKTSCRLLDSKKVKAGFKEVPKISTGKGPMGPLPAYASGITQGITTGAFSVTPK